MIFSQEYNPFGKVIYSYNNGASGDRFKFTGKEYDKETGLNYHGARHYNFGTYMWNSVDPLSEKYPGWSPYNYALNNPINNYDPAGRSVVTDGEQKNKTIAALSSEYGVNFRLDAETGLLSAYDTDGMAITSAEGIDNAGLAALVTAMLDTKVQVILQTQNANFSALDGSPIFTEDFQGSTTIVGGNQVIATQGFNINHANKLEQFGGGSAGNSAAHKILEGWYAGKNFSEQNYQGNNVAPYLLSHNFALSKTYDNSNIIPNIN